eukprot:6210614-Pleurochrysis_carterae.AAC.3
MCRQILFSSSIVLYFIQTILHALVQKVISRTGGPGKSVYCCVSAPCRRSQRSSANPQRDSHGRLVTFSEQLLPPLLARLLLRWRLVNRLSAERSDDTHANSARLKRLVDANARPA